MAAKAFFAFSWPWTEINGALGWFLHSKFQAKPGAFSYLAEFKKFAAARLTEPVWLVLGDWFLSLPASHKQVQSAKRSAGGTGDLVWSPTGKREDPQYQPWNTAHPWSLTVAEWLAVR